MRYRLYTQNCGRRGGGVQKLESESRGDGVSVAGLLQPLKPSTDVGRYLGASVEAVLRIKDKTQYPKWEHAGFLSRDRSRAKSHN